MTKDDIKEAMTETLEEHGITPHTHRLHHAFLEMEMQRQESRRQKWEKFQGSFIGGMALGLLGFLYWIGQLILEHWGGRH